jgi:peptide chain release factor 3
VRLGKKMRLKKPSSFMARERTTIEEAFAGDIIGLYDPGHFRIGDTLTTGTDVRSRASRTSRPSTSQDRASATR